MEEAPIFVRIIIDIPIKESYNHKMCIRDRS